MYRDTISIVQFMYFDNTHGMFNNKLSEEMPEDILQNNSQESLTQKTEQVSGKGGSPHTSSIVAPASLVESIRKMWQGIPGFSNKASQVELVDAKRKSVDVESEDLISPKTERFSYRPFGDIYSLIGGENPAWVPQRKVGEDGSRVVDRAKIVDLVSERVSAVTQREEVNLNEFPVLVDIQENASRFIEDFTSYLIEEGVITEEIRDLTDRLSPSTNIVVLDDKDLITGGVDYSSTDHFPTKPEEQPPIYINPKEVARRVNNFLRDPRMESLLNSISPDQLATGILYAAVNHERSHLLEEALVTKLLETLAQNELYSDFHSDAGINALGRLVGDQVDLTEHIGVGRAYTFNKERFARAFEYKALEYGLLKAGLTPEQVETVVGIKRDSEQQTLQEYRSLLSTLGNGGLDDADILAFVNDISQLSREIGLIPQNSTFNNAVRSEFDFAANLGYSYPPYEWNKVKDAVHTLYAQATGQYPIQDVSKLLLEGYAQDIQRQKKNTDTSPQKTSPLANDAQQFDIQSLIKGVPKGQKTM